MNVNSAVTSEEVLEITGADAALILDFNGNLISATHVEYEENIAAMMEIIFSMCNDLCEDLKKGKLEQLLAKTSDGFLIANKLSTDRIIVILSNDHSKMGLFMKKINSIK